MPDALETQAREVLLQHFGVSDNGMIEPIVRAMLAFRAAQPGEGDAIVSLLEKLAHEHGFVVVSWTGDKLGYETGDQAWTQIEPAALAKPRPDREAVAWQIKQIVADRSLLSDDQLRARIEALATPPRRPALDREGVARALFDFDVATEKRLGRQRNRRWETEMPEYREHMCQKADAVLALYPVDPSKCPKWAGDADPIGELAMKLSAHATSVEEGEGEWTWRDIAQAVTRLLPTEPVQEMREVK